MKEKIIFWLGNDFTHYCMAHSLQNNQNFELYGISEVPAKPRQFLEKQKMVNFKKIWFFHDHIKKKLDEPDLEYLVEFEKKYQIDLWKIIQNERIFLFNDYYKFTKNEILNLVIQECKFFETILEEVKPDYFFSKISSLQHQEIFYQMCQKRGVKNQILNYSMLATTSIISKDPTKLDFTNVDIKTDQTRSFGELREYIKKYDLAKQLKNKILPQGTQNKDLFRAAFSYFSDSSSENSKTHYTYFGRSKYKVFLHTFKELLKTKIRKKFIDKMLKKELDNKLPYVYFPLQMEMERALLLGAPYYINQLEIIKWIAKSLPINYNLVVKEHPIQVARGWRSSKEYKSILNIPNVIFVHPDMETKNIFKNCSLVMTIAGNPGFEALFFGKPVITFKEMRYSFLPSVKTLEKIENIPKLIQEMVDLKIDSEPLDRYLQMLEKNISKFDYAEFVERLGKEFFYNHNLIDVEIHEDQMREFLEKNSEMIDILANDHLKKMEYFKKKNS